jgi:hypothetical protein
MEALKAAVREVLAALGGEAAEITPPKKGVNYKA